MRKCVTLLLICLIAAVCIGSSRRRVVFPVETRKYLITDYDSFVVSSAWEADANDNWMPVTGTFNDLYFELDVNNDITLTTYVFFTQDSEDDLMPLL